MDNRDYKCIPDNLYSLDMDVANTLLVICVIAIVYHPVNAVTFCSLTCRESFLLLTAASIQLVNHIDYSIASLPSTHSRITSSYSVAPTQQ